MITEEQARALFAGEPADTIDAYAVLRAGRRDRVRRRALVASGGVAVAAGTAAFAVASTGGDRPSVVSPATASPSAPAARATVRPSPTTTPLRVEPRQVGNAVLLGGYVEGGVRHEVVMYFLAPDPAFVREAGSEALMDCAAAIRPDRTTVPLGGGCRGPALPLAGKHVGGAGSGLADSDDPGSRRRLGNGFTYTVVSKSVTRGGAYDETGAFHEGSVLGIGDPTLPARVLVVDMGGDHLFRGYRLWDANGTLLADEGPWLDGAASTPTASESPVPHGPE